MIEKTLIFIPYSIFKTGDISKVKSKITEITNREIIFENIFGSAGEIYVLEHQKFVYVIQLEQFPQDLREGYLRWRRYVINWYIGTRKFVKEGKDIKESFVINNIDQLRKLISG